MKLLLEQALHGLNLTCMGIVLAFAVTFVGWMWQARNRALRALAGVTLAEEGGPSPARALRRARAHVHGEQRIWVLHRPVEEVLHDWVETHVMRGTAFEAGPWLTGIALFLTFFLIALVLAESVGPAIRHGGAGMNDLSNAVSTMGAKFVVSMVGILSALVHGFVRSYIGYQLHQAAHTSADRLRTQTTTVLTHQLATAESQVAALATTNELLRPLVSTVDGLQTIAAEAIPAQRAWEERMLDSITRLQSIDVSIQGIGSQLAEDLSRTVKSDIVEGIGQELRDMADDLKNALAESFSETMKTQLAAVVDELMKIEQSVSNQAKDQVGELLNKLGDAVSGGFTSESQRMKDALTRFAEVVPLLEQQMRTLVERTGADIERQREESARTSGALLGRLEEVLGSIAEQQQAAAVSNARMQEFAASTQATLSQSLTQANSEMSDRTREALELLSSAMHGATSQATSVYSELVGEVRDAAQTLHQARVDSVEGAERLASSAAMMRDVLERSRQSADSLRLLSEALGGTLGQANATLESGAQVAAASSQAIEKQQVALQELVERWPNLAREYLQLTDQAFQQVAGTWQKQATAIEVSVKRIGDNVVQNADAFAEAVEELGEQLSRAGIPRATSSRGAG